MLPMQSTDFLMILRMAIERETGCLDACVLQMPFGRSFKISILSRGYDKWFVVPSPAVLLDRTQFDDWCRRIVGVVQKDLKKITV